MISGKLGHFDALMNGFVFLLLGLVRFYIVEVIDVNGKEWLVLVLSMSLMLYSACSK
jgi:hypothetical protein